MFKKIFTFSIFLVCLVLLPSHMSEAEPVLKVSPLVLDFKGKIKDLHKATFEIENTTNNVQYVYASDLPLTATTTDRTTSVERWLRYPHSFELRGLEKKVIDVSLDIPIIALPGVYHAKTVFAYGNTITEAEARMGSAPFFITNLEVVKSSRELLQLKHFGPKQNIFKEVPATFLITVDNVGTETLRVNGTIRIYDKYGKELGEVLVPEFSFEPKAKKDMNISWTGGTNLGRKKAFLELRYGKDEDRVVTDTAFFWLIDLRKVIALFVAGLFLVIVITYTLRKMFAQD